jgi:type II secretory pathway component PulF
MRFLRPQAQGTERIRIAQTERFMLVHRLHTYLRAGIPLLSALDLVREHMATRSGAQLTALVIARIEQGNSLAYALRAFPRSFPAFYIHLIAAGERSGTLQDACLHVSSTMQRAAQLRKRIIAAFVYPVLIFVCTVGLCALLIFGVFPKLLPLFRSMHTQLPFPTRVLVFISHDAKSHTWLLLGMLIGMIAMCILLSRSQRVRVFFERVLLVVPHIRTCIQSYFTASIFRTLSMLLRSGVRIDEGLILCGEGLQHTAYIGALEHCRQRVLSGAPLSSGLEQYTRLFAPGTTALIRSGEQAGTLPESAGTVSSLAEDDLDDRLRTLTTLLEPVLLLFMAGVVGFVALATISPIYGITQALSAH